MVRLEQRPLPGGSYLETSGRSAFENGGGAIELHLEFSRDDARVGMVWRNFGYAPFADDEQLERVRAMLRWQAALLSNRHTHSKTARRPNPRLRRA